MSEILKFCLLILIFKIGKYYLIGHIMQQYGTKPNFSVNTPFPKKFSFDKQQTNLSAYI